jgi:hypothetical protein
MYNGAEIRAWIESSAKLIAALVAAGAVLAGSIIAANYESKLTSVNLLSQREDSESRIRSSMFQTLVEPITRLSKGDRLDPTRYRVLVEVLTLNFHDQVEVKPLLSDVDRILSEENDQLGRRSIRSIARRVIDRQIASLSGTSHAVHGKPAKADTFYFQPVISDATSTESDATSTESDATSTESDATSTESDATSTESDATSASHCQGTSLEQAASTPGGIVCSESPDKKYHLEIILGAPEIDDFKAPIYITICKRKPPCGREQDIIRKFDFTLTHFDFPLTDNSQIDPELRFAISLYSMEVEQPIVIKVIWFPKGFVTARERPMNYLTLRKILDVEGE